jgi:hypothetical protein
MVNRFIYQVPHVRLNQRVVCFLSALKASRSNVRPDDSGGPENAERRDDQSADLEETMDRIAPQNS